MKLCCYVGPGWSWECGGHMMLYRLAYQLRAELGVDARVWNEQPGWNPYGVPHADREWAKDAWVVYPEIVLGNPLEAARVVRWELNKVGFFGFGDAGTWGPDDLRVAYAPKFRHHGDEELLTLLDLWPEFIYPGSGPRQGTCFVFKNGAHKTPISETELADFRHVVPPDAGEVFRRYERFISYDITTWLSVQAALCGCLSIVVPDEGITAEDWRAAHPFYQYGIAYGVDDIDHARETLPLLRPHLEGLEVAGRLQVERLLHRMVQAS